MSAVEYGIICAPTDEKKLVKNVNDFLATCDYRKMSKRVPSGIRDPDRIKPEPRYSHYYSQFLKEHPRWYFDLYPNVDLEGEARFPSNLECGWTLYVNKVMPENNSQSDNEQLDKFFSELTLGTGFKTVLLHKYNQDENRI